MEGNEAMSARVRSESPTGERVRKLSLASQLETMTESGAFLRAIQENRPEVAVCRLILQTKPGRRSLDDIHVLKSLLGASKLLEFFANLDAYKIDKLYQSIDIVVFDEKGSIVFEQDDPGDSFYMVFRGQVEIRQRDASVPDAVASKKPPTVHIAYLNPGDSFGERALLYETDQRAASAITSADQTELLFINRNVFTDLLRESQEADTSSSTLEITKRFRSNKDIIRNIFMRASAQRSEKDLKFAVEYLKSVKFFSRFSFEIRKQLCKAMKLISAVTNTVLFEEGQEGRHFYIIFSGSVEVSVRAKNRFDEAAENIVSKLSEGEYFGELALSETGGVRRATVVCADFCELLVLGRDQYEPLIKKYQNEYHAQYAKMLSKNVYFTGPEWDEYTIQAMCAVMAEKYFPFRSEICKQGSRATEMFVVTRGECVVIHEGKHPITGQPQQYELGRYGPNSVLGCAEASAGRFNDIFIRDYSIVAESPVRLLVLSRFDIFHLMSAEARESLQRSSVGYLRESIESRAIKTVAWEKYRKAFLAEVIERQDVHNSPTKARSHTKTMTKSSSTPTLSVGDGPLKRLVQPGEFLLESHQRRSGKIPPERKRAPCHGDFGQTLQTTDVTDSLQPVKSTAVDERRRNTVHHTGSSVSSAVVRVKDDMAVMTETNATEEENDEEQNRVEPIPSRAIRERRRSIVRSKTIAVLETVSTSPTSTQQSTSFPRLFQEKPLYGSSELSDIMTHLSVPGSASNNGSERRRSARLRSDAALRIPGAATSLAAVWIPVHGANLPFAVLGFQRAWLPVPVATAKPQRSSSAISPPLVPTAGMITAFRLFGKFAALDSALELFRHVCSVETMALGDGATDASRFVIYKDDEMVMSLENYYAPLTTDGGGGRQQPHQYRAIDLPQATGQRFACVSVTVDSPPRLLENVAVHVYQCFPTPQSAVRFAKQTAATALATMVLYIVPLFDWVPLADLDRFDARSNDLEQALESIALTTSTGGIGKPLSTWKTRKDAMKKARLQSLKLG